jgi:nitrite reductase (NADH) small subunit
MPSGGQPEPCFSGANTDIVYTAVAVQSRESRPFSGGPASSTPTPANPRPFSGGPASSTPTPANPPAGSRASPHPVCPADKLAPGSRKIVTVRGRSVGVFNVGGNYYALRNQCPHKGAPLCEGTVGGTFLPSSPHEYVYGMDATVLRCPWHGWEFDLSDGHLLFGTDGTRVKSYRVTVEDGMVVVHA